MKTMVDRYFDKVGATARQVAEFQNWFAEPSRRRTPPIVRGYFAYRLKTAVRKFVAAEKRRKALESRLRRSGSKSIEDKMSDIRRKPKP